MPLYFGDANYNSLQKQKAVPNHELIPAKLGNVNSKA